MGKLLLLFFIFNFICFAKMGPRLPGTIARVMPIITPTEAIQKITDVLDEVQSGSRALLVKGCRNISYTSDATLLKVTIEGEHYYVLQTDQAINGINYLESNCVIGEDGHAIDVNCIARTVDINEKDKSLRFNIRYGIIDNYKVLYNCPF